MTPDAPKPLAEAARRLRAGELPPEQMARVQREQKWAAKERERLAQEHARREQARREDAIFWAAHEALMNQRPEPPAVPVPDEVRWTLYNRPPRMGAARPRNGY